MSVGRPGTGPEVLAKERHDSRWRSELAQRWAERLSATAYIPMSREALEQSLLQLVTVFVDALDEPDSIDTAGRTVGERLVGIHATGEESLSRSLELLRDSVVTPGGDDALCRVLSLLTGVAAGYASADRERTFDQQESLKRALLRSKLQADRDLRVSEARFHEVFTSTPIGIAICDLTGKFVEVNPALEETLGYRERDLASMTIHDLFHSEDAEYLSAAYAELAEGGTTYRLRERRRLLCADGDEAWTYLAVSALRGADGTPSHSVTMVEDISELHLLQQRFQYQALHDVMTGLPNRQYFRTRLETAAGNLPTDGTLTMYHLGLDGFELINDGLGHEVGDHIIKAVARRLEQLIEGEEALVARFGGTEFGILVWESPQTPKVPEFAAMINDELAEPIYIDEHGLATSASIGVVQRTVAESDPPSMMWAADVALRRAEAVGKRQWALFDPARAPDERTQAKLAAVMPGALEMGGFEVVYRPVLTLSDRCLVGLEPRLSWEPEGHGRLGHAECLALAEQSGVTLSLRDWMLGTVWEQFAAWHAVGYRPRLLCGLSLNQAQDPDLVARVREVLARTDLDSKWMRLHIPVSALIGDAEETRANVHTLDAMGVQVALDDFHASPEEMRWLRQLPVRGVALAHELVRLVHEQPDDEAPEVRALHGVTPMVQACGTPIIVCGIETEEQAERWRSLGCGIGAGDLYGDPLEPVDVPDLLNNVPPPAS